VPWLLLRSPELLKSDERDDLERVLAADGLLDSGYELVQRFRFEGHINRVKFIKRAGTVAPNSLSFAQGFWGQTELVTARARAERQPSRSSPQVTESRIYTVAGTLPDSGAH
jgi:hypothetical protein